MSTASPSVVIGNTFGALYIGVVAAMGLWGVVSVQIYYYFNQYPGDAWQLKVLVISVWTLDTVHQGLITHACYRYLVSNYANPMFLLVLVPTLEVMVLFSAIVCLLVQSFLLYRVWRLSKKNVLLVGALFLLAVAQFITTSIFFGKGIRMSSFAEVPSIAWLAKLSNSFSAATDVCIAVTLIFLLHRSRTGFKTSETIINRLILFAINTGAATSIFALLTILFVSLYPNSLIYVSFYVCISRMYANTLLATLNGRKATRDGAGASVDQPSSAILSRERPEGERRAINRSYNDRVLAIHVETETTHGADNIVLDDLQPRGDTESKVDAASENSYSYDKKVNFSRV